MSQSIRVYTKTKRAPETGVMVGVRLQPDMLDWLDAEREKIDPMPSRPEMVRRLLNEAKLNKRGSVE